MRARKFVARCYESTARSVLDALEIELEKPNPDREHVLFLFDELQTALALSRSQIVMFFEEEHEENGPEEEDEG